jgi:hypothetical protein
VTRHPAGPALLTEPDVGPVVAAPLVVSWSRRGRVRDEAAFASLAGVAPLEAAANAPGTGSAEWRPKPQPRPAHRCDHPAPLP